MRKNLITGLLLTFFVSSGLEAGMKLAYPLEKKGEITSGYGWRVHPVTRKREWHPGIDLAVSKGTEVRAVADGQVIYTGWLLNGGWTVKIKHKNSVVSTYKHLSRILVNMDAVVYVKQKIGLSGNSGLSTGPHLHFSISKNKKYINPAPVLKLTGKVRQGPVGGGIEAKIEEIKNMDIPLDCLSQIRKNLTRTVRTYALINGTRIPEIAWGGLQ